jgi:metal-sulfur cluster biosynthetic enzyme
MSTVLAPALFDEVEEALKDVVDPELGVNIVDLGLIYDLSWDPENNALIISMTLTSAGCPLKSRLHNRSTTWWKHSGLTGYGCHRGARKRSPTMVVT